MSDAASESEEIRDRIERDAQRRRQRRMASPGHALLQLLRLPNIFTAMADVMMGFLFVQTASPWRDGPWTPTVWDIVTLTALLSASGLLYAAGVVLNDVFDLEIDRRERPDRPLPSGRILVAWARRFGYRLLLMGVAAATATALTVGHFAPGTVAALLAVTILLYDAWLKRTPLGPMAMGACRALNVLLGMAACDATLRTVDWLVAGGLGVYVVGVTWFARNESRQSDRRHLTLATLVITLGMAMIAWLPRWSDRVIAPIQRSPGLWYLLVGALGVVIVRRCVAAIVDPGPSRVKMAVTQCVLSIVMLDAVACYSMRGVYWATGILLFWVPALLAARWIETT